MIFILNYKFFLGKQQYIDIFTLSFSCVTGSSQFPPEDSVIPG